MSSLQSLAVELVKSGIEVPILHDDCGNELRSYDLDCPCPLRHYWCPGCQFTLEIELDG